MKIKDLKSPYRELASKYAYRKWSDEDICNGLDLRKAFIWCDTEEGDQFWYDVYNGLEPKFPQPSETPEQDNTLTEVLKEINDLINYHIEINYYGGDEPSIGGKSDLLTAIGEFLKSNYELKSKQ